MNAPAAELNVEKPPSIDILLPLAQSAIDSLKIAMDAVEEKEVKEGSLSELIADFQEQRNDTDAFITGYLKYENSYGSGEKAQEFQSKILELRLYSAIYTERIATLQQQLQNMEENTEAARKQKVEDLLKSFGATSLGAGMTLAETPFTCSTSAETLASENFWLSDGVVWMRHQTAAGRNIAFGLRAAPLHELVLDSGTIGLEYVSGARKADLEGWIKKQVSPESEAEYQALENGRFGYAVELGIFPNKKTATAYVKQFLPEDRKLFRIDPCSDVGGKPSYKVQTAATWDYEVRAKDFLEKYDVNGEIKYLGDSLELKKSHGEASLGWDDFGYDESDPLKFTRVADRLRAALPNVHIYFPVGDADNPDTSIDRSVLLPDLSILGEGYTLNNAKQLQQYSKRSLISLLRNRNIDLESGRYAFKAAIQTPVGEAYINKNAYLPEKTLDSLRRWDAFKFEDINIAGSGRTDFMKQHPNWREDVKEMLGSRIIDLKELVVGPRSNGSLKITAKTSSEEVTINLPVEDGSLLKSLKLLWKGLKEL